MEVCAGTFVWTCSARLTRVGVGLNARSDKRAVSQEYATTTTTTASVFDVTTITTTITVTPEVDATTTTRVGEVSPTLSPSDPSVHTDAGSVTSLTVADALGSSTTSSPPAAITQAIAGSSSSSSSSRLTPNGIKAGSAGGDAYPFWSEHIGWWYDWTPVPLENYPDNTGSPIPVVMLWGDGHVSDGDALRYHEFLNLTTTPRYILGFEEPDCSPPDSSDIASNKGAQVWNKVIAPWKKKGSLLGSPSMCSASPFLSLCLLRFLCR